MSNLSNLINIQGLKSIHRVSNKVIQHWVNRCDCPCYQVGSYDDLSEAVFDKADVSEWKTQFNYRVKENQEKLAAIDQAAYEKQSEEFLRRKPKRI